jgi:hypothetical protein
VLENTDHKTGAMLNHIEAVYRPGERQLAIDLFEALGCATADTGVMNETGSSYISVHPDPGDRNYDNVIYLGEMAGEQLRLEDMLRQRSESDGELRASLDLFRTAAHERPFGFAHIAVRYPSFESLQLVLDRIEDRLTPELKPRVRINVFRPGDHDEVGPDSIQAFVYTDVVACGLLAAGQVLELAAYK